MPQYQVREFAELAGVSVRMLHHYDRLELLRPKRRTQAGYRLYELADLERLEQIVALKYMGLSLKQIRTALGGDPVGLISVLGIQRRLLEEKRRILDRAIQAIREAEAQWRSKGEVDSAALKSIMEAIEMETKEDWTAKYATEEGRAKIEARKHLWSPELQERVSRQWNELIAEVEQALEEDPAGEKAQALAARWTGLVEEFTGRDKDVEASVARMWADRQNWPVDTSQKAPLITPQVCQFIARAKQAGRG